MVKPHINMEYFTKMIEEAIKDGARFLPKASAHKYGLLKKKQPVILELLERKAKAFDRKNAQPSKANSRPKYIGLRVYR